MNTKARIIVGTAVGYAILVGTTSGTRSSAPAGECVHIGSGSAISGMIRGTLPVVWGCIVEADRLIPPPRAKKSGECFHVLV